MHLLDFGDGDLRSQDAYDDYCVLVELSIDVILLDRFQIQTFVSFHLPTLVSVLLILPLKLMNRLILLIQDMWATWKTSAVDRCEECPTGEEL
jgi:hypothetical protein